MTTEEMTAATVGVRSYQEVAVVLAAANTEEACSARFGRGVLAAYRWALGGQVAAPITAAAPPGAAGPSHAQLRAECQAALAEVLGHARRTVELDYARGVHEALAWLCGHSDEVP
ncbi:hypothetical protein [Kitasatospora sp. NPDC050543]|uniref:hypothetical protein n=1 Tax=Kitasatospora sp. NPDC050543 TaxID=3364054 RepID=UPI0037A6CCC5